MPQIQITPAVDDAAQAQIAAELTRRGTRVLLESVFPDMDLSQRPQKQQPEHRHAPREIALEEGVRLQIVHIYRYVQNAKFHAQYCADSPGEHSVFELVLSDGVFMAKSILHPSLNFLVHRGTVQPLDVVQVRALRVVYDDDSKFRDTPLLMVTRVQHATRRSLPLVLYKHPRARRLEWHSQATVLEALARPLFSFRAMYAHARNDTNYERRDGRWREPIDVRMNADTLVEHGLPTLQQAIRYKDSGSARASFVAGPLVGRMVEKSGVRFLASSQVLGTAAAAGRQRYGCLFKIVVEDSSMRVPVYFWDAAVPLFYNALVHGDIVYLDGVRIRPALESGEGGGGIEGSVNIRRTETSAIAHDDLLADVLEDDDDDGDSENVERDIEQLRSGGTVLGARLRIVDPDVNLREWPRADIELRFPFRDFRCRVFSAVQNLRLAELDARPIDVCGRVVYVGPRVRYRVSLERFLPAEDAHGRPAIFSSFADEPSAANLSDDDDDDAAVPPMRTLEYRWLLLQDTSSSSLVPFKVYDSTSLPSIPSSSGGGGPARHFFDDVRAGHVLIMGNARVKCNVPPRQPLSAKSGGGKEEAESPKHIVSTQSLFGIWWEDLESVERDVGAAMVSQVPPTHPQPRGGLAVYHLTEGGCLHLPMPMPALGPAYWAATLTAVSFFSLRNSCSNLLLGGSHVFMVEADLLQLAFGGWARGELAEEDDDDRFDMLSARSTPEYSRAGSVNEEERTLTPAAGAKRRHDRDVDSVAAHTEDEEEFRQGTPVADGSAAKRPRDALYGTPQQQQGAAAASLSVPRSPLGSGRPRIERSRSPFLTPGSQSAGPRRPALRENTDGEDEELRFVRNGNEDEEEAGEEEEEENLHATAEAYKVRDRDGRVWCYPTVTDDAALDRALHARAPCVVTLRDVADPANGNLHAVLAPNAVHGLKSGSARPDQLLTPWFAQTLEETFGVPGKLVIPGHRNLPRIVRREGERRELGEAALLRRRLTEELEAKELFGRPVKVVLHAVRSNGGRLWEDKSASNEEGGDESDEEEEEEEEGSTGKVQGEARPWLGGVELRILHIF